MEKKANSGADALKVEAIDIDINRITDFDLELIYGEPAKEVRRKVAHYDAMDAIAEDLRNMNAIP